MQAMACCTMFKTCAKDPFSYSHINLTTSVSNVSNKIVRTMIRRAGKELRSLELGHVVRSDNSTTPLLTGKCLAPLSDNDGFIGKCLRSIHLYDVKSLQNSLSIDALAACSNITDLKIVGSYKPPEKLLKSLATKCCFIEHLFLETYGFPSSRSRKVSRALVDFLTNNPNLTSLTLIGFRLNDATAQILVESARKLEYMNLSRNPTIKGHFLRHSCKDSLVKTLILRDCLLLEEKEVLQFLNSLSTGNFRFIKHIDITNYRGLLSDGRKSSFNPK
ncbi:unnamed protein product [Microthlaspi erraticum]|uniref:FBD domain-containing protein n=1 Tax=Microthlaspi erraticum TaxID=1685480 RepID=A0A6D2L0X0_9BRAS|nr:unnamed protein product [Microthlaspi erraticum]